MKKFIKICVLTSIITALIGVGLIMLAMRSGARVEDIPFRENFVFHGNYEISDLAEPEGVSVGDYNLEIEKSQNLEVKVLAGYELEIREKAGIDSIQLYWDTDLSDNNQVGWKEDGDTLKVTVGRRNWLKNSDWGERKVVLSIPEGWKFDKTEIDVAGSGVRADSLSSRELVIDVSAGGLDMNDVTAEDLDIQCSMGGVEFSGKVSGNVDIDCDAGGVDLSLDGEETQFDYELKNNIGSILLGTAAYDAFSMKKEIDNGAKNTMDISVNAGNVSVSFDK